MSYNFLVTIPYTNPEMGSEYFLFTVEEDRAPTVETVIAGCLSHNNRDGLMNSFTALSEECEKAGTTLQEVWGDMVEGKNSHSLSMSRFAGPFSINKIQRINQVKVSYE